MNVKMFSEMVMSHLNHPNYKDGVVKVWNPINNQMVPVIGVSLRRNADGHEILIEIDSDGFINSD